jgi:hypothetical protein
LLTKESYKVRYLAKQAINGYKANSAKWIIEKTRADPRFTMNRFVPKPLSSKYSFKPDSSVSEVSTGNIFGSHISE